LSEKGAHVLSRNWSKIHRSTPSLDFGPDVVEIRIMRNIFVVSSQTTSSRQKEPSRGSMMQPSELRSVLVKHLLYRIFFRENIVSPFSYNGKFIFIEKAEDIFFNPNPTDK
jgi:hypothetical protein